MNFISLVFLGFLVIVTLVYFLVPKKGRYVVLLVASLVFYAYAGWQHLLYLLSIILFTYLGGLILSHNRDNEKEYLIIHEEEMSKEDKKIYRKRNEGKRKKICGLFVILLVLLLFVVKYFNTLISIFKESNPNIPSDLKIILPLGLSFFLFQGIGYVIDCHRGIIVAEKNFMKYMLFMSYFPQLLQGPIERYADLAPQLYIGHDFDETNFINGTRRILIGFFKKVAIADILAKFVSSVKADDNATGFIVILMLLAYAVELYCDFSGFMDIACGVSEIFSIKLTENFDKPYLSKSIAEFWRRWHITLGSWFRDYLYYPILNSALGRKLLMKRKTWSTELITVIGLLAVWVSMGFWHGSSLNFLLYGLYHGFFIIISYLLEPFFKKLRLKFNVDEKSFGYQAFCVIRTFLIVMFGYVLFITSSLAESGNLIVRMFSSSGLGLILDGKLSDYHLNLFNFLIVVISILVLLIDSDVIRIKKPIFVSEEKELSLQKTCFSILMVAVICFSWILLYSQGDYSSDFVYFQF
jgi:alginate O-acetyltransferase complex protein AlgI